MKKSLVLILCLACGPVFGQLDLSSAAYPPLAMKAKMVVGTSPFFTENFEGVGYDTSNANGWSESTTGAFPDWTGVVLQGSHSLLLSNAIDAVFISATLSTFRPNVFIKMQFRVIDETFSPILLRLMTNNVTQFSCVVQSDTRFVRLNNLGETVDSLVAVTTGTDYYFWGEFHVGDGGTGISRVWIGTANNKAAATITASIINGDSINAPNQIQIGSGNGGKLALDAIQLSTTEIP